ncbi:MAG: hypothetical protein FWH56_12190, partial [Betaproteobacteria bacterium]|nr:hypothetical protein [Betaproteobacteria bacterium]
PAFNLSQDQTLEFNPKAPKITDFEYSISLLQTCFLKKQARAQKPSTHTSSVVHIVKEQNP